MMTKPEVKIMVDCVRVHEMPKNEAISFAKSIQRHIRKRDIMGAHSGEGQEYGVDFVTWHICHPHLADVFCELGRVVTGRDGRFMPRF
jgi:hypothetical protein